jgi:hypothetical protein
MIATLIGVLVSAAEPEPDGVDVPALCGVPQADRATPASAAVAVTAVKRMRIVGHLCWIEDRDGHHAMWHV